MQNQFIYLASASPRRAQLLDQLGVRYEMLLADGRENVERLEEPRSRELPADYVRRVAKLKLDAARERRLRRRLPEAPILCADTTVALGRKMFGKPAHPAEAREMLTALSGRSHRVLTAVAVSAGPLSFVEMNVTRVEFSAFGTLEIDGYIASGEPRGKAGAYAIQGRAARWVKHINGSYSGVMGLPLHETAVLLRRAGLTIL
ncbi:Maf family protein [Piscinibacter sakaiensis]|uniref:Maf family protein n=1 Tax=Piscinibacter sakaiensis TaxID=1547922 RepID=UPI003AB05133